MKNQKLSVFERIEKVNCEGLAEILEETEAQVEDARQLLGMCRKYPLKERETECLGNLEEAVDRMLLDVENQIFGIVQIMKKAEEE